MTVLFKLPPQASNGDTLAVSAKPYGNVSLAPGDRVFLWWSEAQGGAGLVGYGTCLSTASTSDSVEAVVEPVRVREAGVGFGRERLRPFRDVAGDAPEATLAKTLYKHSLNKVVQISPSEEAFLEELF